MSDRFPVKITIDGSQVEAIIEYSENELLVLDIGGYKLESVGFYQNWEITEDSHKAQGNKFGFKVSVDDNEIQDLEFTLKLFLKRFDNKGEYPTNLTVRFNYQGYKLKVNLNVNELEINSVNDSLENVFIELSNALSKNNHVIRSCFTCAFSGYEKGGGALFCMKKNGGELVSKPYNDGYNSWFEGMDKVEVLEFYECSEYEYLVDRKKH